MRVDLSVDKEQKILVVGAVKDAVCDCSHLNGRGIAHCENMLDGIVLAKREIFDDIFVVMSSFDTGLQDGLSALRGANRSARIKLLAQMYEEPLARGLIRDANRPGNVVDDYLICPVTAEELAGNGRVQPQTTGDVGAAEVPNVCVEERIRELERLATEDDLTCVKNRRYVREFLRQIMERAGAEDFNVTLLVFDIDNFKHYNDTYGHAVGDNVLVQTASMMVGCFREHDVVGRVGGDEFAVVFWDCPEEKKVAESDKPESERRACEAGHPREAFFLAERFRRVISSMESGFIGPKGKGLLTISGGLAAFPVDGGTVEELFEQADKALLEAKRSGKNRVYLVGQPKEQS